MTRITYEAWLRRFQPVSNPFDENAAVDGYLLQPRGQEWDFVKKHDARCIWALVITDLIRSSIWTITDGIHIVNREGYLVTTRPFNPKCCYAIRY